MLTQEKINSNFVLFTKKLEKYGCYSEDMFRDLGEEIKNCSFSLNEDSGAAYQGSMIDVVLNTLCKTAYHINECAFSEHPDLKVNTDMLMRVLLLQHIAKAQMFTATREQWKIKKGQFYDFNINLVSNLKLGERTLFLCQKYGITLIEEEYEALRIIDKLDDSKGDTFSSPLAMIVKTANMFTALELRRKALKNKKEETLEK